jgi:hypothetical protein
MLFLEGIHVPDIQVVNYEKEIGRGVLRLAA